MQGTSSSHHNENTDIVCFSLSRWDAEISSPAVSLAKELSRHHRVFFIEHPYTWKDVATGKRKKTKSRWDGNVLVVKPQPVLPINFLPEGKWYDRLSSYNNSILLGTLKRTIAQNNIARYIFINFFDPWFLRTLPAEIRPVTYVYQCMDDISMVEYTSRHGVRLENEVIRQADIVLCTSKELMRLKSVISPHVFFHPNAADFTLFNTAAQNRYERPADMKFSDKKIIGFTGSIEYRMDFELLKKAATVHADKIFFLVGPVTGNEHIKTGLTDMPNIVFAGAKNIGELPAYLQYFDCCIIPYRINTLTASIYPLKINEYLAAGKPVVTTNFSEDIFSFRDVAYVSDTHDEFIVNINKAIEEKDDMKKQQRIAVASANSWAERVKTFWTFFS
jgi:teichuronic acid biosynthesis glycosyltransferase TuaH